MNRTHLHFALPPVGSTNKLGLPQARGGIAYKNSMCERFKEAAGASVAGTLSGDMYMSDFRQLTDDFWASPQIGIGDVAEAKARGIALIVNNRPEGEAADQVPGAEIEEAARSAGIEYRAIPVTHAGFSEEQVRAMAAAIDDAGGPVLAYCRSGTRSTL